MGNKLTGEHIEAICKQVYGRFPTLMGVRPQVKRQRTDHEDRFLLRFEATLPLPDGASLSIIVRVVANSAGQVLKLTSSR